MAPEAPLQHGSLRQNAKPPVLKRNLKRGFSAITTKSNHPRKKPRIFPCWDALKLETSPLSTPTRLSVELTKLDLRSNSHEKSAEGDSKVQPYGQPVPCEINAVAEVHNGEQYVHFQSPELCDVQRAYIQRFNYGNKQFCKIFQKAPCQIGLAKAYRTHQFSGQWRRLYRPPLHLSIHILFQCSADCNAILSFLSGEDIFLDPISTDPFIINSNEGALSTRWPITIGQQPQANYPVIFEETGLSSIPEDIYLNAVQYVGKKRYWVFEADIAWDIPLPEAKGFIDHRVSENVVEKSASTSNLSKKNDANETAVESSKKPLRSPMVIKDVESNHKPTSQSTPKSKPATSRSSAEKPAKSKLAASSSTNHSISPLRTGSDMQVSRKGKGPDGVEKSHSAQIRSPQNLAKTSKKTQANQETKAKQKRVVKGMQRKRYEVPNAPEGVAYYRTFSRRELKAGEYLSESDEDIEEPWLKHLHVRTIEKLPGPSRAEKKFMKLFDLGLFDSKPSGDSGLAEYLKNFAEYHSRLFKTDSEMARQFYVKATTLLLDDVITHQTFEECLKIIETGSVRSTGRSRSETANDIFLDNEAKSQKPWRLACTCGEQVLSVRDAIVCSNPACEHREYHLQCVGVESRPDKWICDSCKGQRRAKTKK